jgi:hypothetical protein
VRTTINIDEELLEKLKDIARKRKAPLKEVVNEALRRGLTVPRTRDSNRTPYRIEAFSSDFRPGVDPERLNQLSDALDVERFSGAPGR